MDYIFGFEKKINPLFRNNQALFKIEYSKTKNLEIFDLQVIKETDWKFNHNVHFQLASTGSVALSYSYQQEEKANL